MMNAIIQHSIMLQQYLPFTVLKQKKKKKKDKFDSFVATVLTVYGIETYHIAPLSFTNRFGVATVLTVYGIETGNI